MIPQQQPRRFSARAVVGGLLAASILGAGVALAAEHAGSGPAVSIAPAASNASPSASPSPGKHGDAPRHGRGFGGFGGLGPGQLIGVLTKDTGLTPMQILADIGNGQTLRQISGSNADKVRTDALAAVKTRLDAAVTKGVINATQEATLLKDAGDAVDVLMDANLSKLGLGSGKHFPFGGGHSEEKPTPSATPSA